MKVFAAALIAATAMGIKLHEEGAAPESKTRLPLMGGRSRSPLCYEEVDHVAELKKLGEKIFKETDKNGDGHICIDEAKAAADHMGEELDEEDFKNVAGEDGVVSGEEAHKAGKAAMDEEFGEGWGDEEAKAVTDAIKKELGEAAQVSDKQALKELGESLFHLTDMNDDGHIDIDEAKAAAEFMDMEWNEEAAEEFKKIAGEDNLVNKAEAGHAFEKAMADEFGEDWGDKEAKMVVDAVEAELEAQKPDFEDFEMFVSEWCGADDIDHDDLHNFYDNASIEEWEGAFIACTGADNLADAVDIIIAAEFADAMAKNHEDKPAKEAAQVSEKHEKHHDHDHDHDHCEKHDD